MRRLGWTFWVETVAAVLAVALGLLTLAWPTWIERVFGVEPDGGDGSLEIVIVLALAAVALVTAWLARRQWQQAAIEA